MPAPLPVDLYAILDRSVAGNRPLREILDGIIAGGGRLVQLREKEWSVRQCLPLASELRRLAKESGVTFIVNDRLDLALAVEADGLHVGQDDLPAPVARRLLGPGRLLGVSTHSVEQAVQAQADGADYVAIGSIYQTSTKTNFELVGLEMLRAVRSQFVPSKIVLFRPADENLPEIIRFAKFTESYGAIN
ncbi:MAG: thiamine phosphate synthase, partial [candidate division NC10 bacterium]